MSSSESESEAEDNDRVSIVSEPQTHSVTPIDLADAPMTALKRLLRQNSLNRAERKITFSLNISSVKDLKAFLKDKSAANKKMKALGIKPEYRDKIAKLFKDKDEESEEEEMSDDDDRKSRKKSKKSKKKSKSKDKKKRKRKSSSRHDL